VTALGAHRFSPQPGTITAHATPVDAKRLPSLRVLVAEDNPVNALIATKMLEKLGVRADVVGNGQEAMEAVARQVYDVVFMDIQMPEMDGLDATRAIQRRWAPDERPRIVGLSAHAVDSERQGALAAGMDDYLVKPIDIKKLESALATLTPRRESDIERRRRYGN
jgi:CheY-like chemotaxis protein